jgi:hypothetical protein
MRSIKYGTNKVYTATDYPSAVGRRNGTKVASLCRKYGMSGAT